MTFDIMAKSREYYILSKHSFVPIVLRGLIFKNHFIVSLVSLCLQNLSLRLRKHYIQTKFSVITHLNKP